MDEETRRQYLLARVDELLSQMPEESLRQLIQVWEMELEILVTKQSESLSFEGDIVHQLTDL